MTSVWGSGPSDVWAVGSGTVLHWDGSAWSSLSSGTLQAVNASAVWGSGQNDVWIVGSGVVHWDGAAWSNVSIDLGNYGSAHAVWGSGPSDVWVLGWNAAYHWNGTAFARALDIPGNLSPPTPTLISLYAIWGSGLNDVWVGGSTWNGQAYVDPTGLALHWDGSTWSNFDTGTTSGALASIWGSGPNDVWAVGQKGTILHWNGSAWSGSASGVTRPLLAVWGSGPGDVWAVGGCHDGNVLSENEQGSVLHHGP
jgi:hypothetical protein